MAIKETEAGLISHLNSDSIISEQYRAIRTNLFFSSVEQKEQTLMITSPNYGEGKSTTITNLAISMVQQGEKVLIIDADLRKPMLHTTFKLENNIGFTSLLKREVTFQAAVNQTEVEGLDIITSGPIPTNPAKLLTSQSVEKMLVLAKNQYDMILFDSSPVLEVADPRILANKCDGVLLVLSHGKTDKEQAIESKRVLELVRAKIVGIILNQK